jgi:hypothetical protein
MEVVRALLHEYFEALQQSDQQSEVNRLSALTIRPAEHFVKIVPLI